MAKITPISGFPEFLPQERIIEQQALDTIREVYELYGFTSLETRTVEPVDVLSGNGDDKEIYAINRLFADDKEKKDSKLALHFDLTVPFARYVQQNKGELMFPFRRYQSQKVFRGERPQEGRYREFLQTDIDIIAENELPLYNDIEVLQTLFTAFYELEQSIGIPSVKIRLNSRKVLEGFYLALGISDISSTLRIVDKIDKIGAQKVQDLLLTELKLTNEQAEKCVDIAQVKTNGTDFVQKVRDFGVKHEMLDEGLTEMEEIMNTLVGFKERNFPADIKSEFVVDMSIARGLAYYTGMVFETFLNGFENLGSVSSGGRYDNLASTGKVKLPGVGASIGLTRILAVMFAKGVIEPKKKSAADVFITVNDMQTRSKATLIAEKLRHEGVKVEISDKDNKLGKQIMTAEKKGMQFVMFYDEDNSDLVTLKNIETGDQVEFNINHFAEYVELD